MKRLLAITLVALWLGYQLRIWVECQSCGAWVRTGQGMQCNGNA